MVARTNISACIKAWRDDSAYVKSAEELGGGATAARISLFRFFSILDATRQALTQVKI